MHPKYLEQSFEVRARETARTLIRHLEQPNADPDAVAQTIFVGAGREPALHLETFIREDERYRQPPIALILRLFILGVRTRAFGPQHLAVAAILQDIAHYHLVAGSLAAAEPTLARAITICDAHHSEAVAAAIACLIDLGTVRRERGDFAGAADALHQALARAESRGQFDPCERTAALSALADLERDRGSGERARTFSLKHCRVAAEHFGAGAPEAILAMVECAAIEIEFQLAAPAEVEARIAAAIEILRPSGDVSHPELWRALHSMGRLHLECGRYPQALGLLREAHAAAVTTFGAIHAHSRTVKRSLADLAMLYGPPVVARQVLEGLLTDLIEQFGSRPIAQIDLLIKLGAVSIRLGDFDAAWARTEEAIALFQTIGDADHPRWAACLEQRAALDLRAGRYGAAQDGYERALTARRYTPDASARAAFAPALSGLAAIRSDLGDHADATRLQAAALAALASRYTESHPAMAEARSRLAGILLRASAWAAATREAQRAYDSRRQALGSAFGTTHAELAGSLRDRAALHLAAGAFGPARDAYADSDRLIRKAFGDTHPALIGSCLGQAVALSGLGEIGAAGRHVATALAILAAHPCPEDEWRAYAVLADIAAAANRPGSAIAFGKFAVALLQSMRLTLEPLDDTLQRGFVRERASVYVALAGRLVRAARFPEALEVRTMLKALELRQSAPEFDDRGTAPAQAVSLTSGEQRHLRKGGAIRRALGARIRAAERVGNGVPYRPKHRRTLAGLEVARAKLADALGAWIDHEPPAALDRGRAGRQELPPMADGTAVLDYLAEPDRLTIVATTSRGRVSLDVAVRESDLNELVFDLWSDLRHRSDTVLGPARRLYDLLIGPIRHRLREEAIRELRLSLDGALRYVPFAILHDGDRYLVEAVAVSSTTLGGAGAPTRARGDPRAAGFGVTGRVSELHALPFVKAELAGIIRTAEALHGILPGTVCLDTAFTAEALRRGLRSSPDVVHIASHFMFQPARDLGSWLLLGDGSRLTAAELLTTAFDFRGVEVLALSACDTAVASGPGRRGREIDTLPSLLRARGVGTVLASLWPVGDASTATLMRTFYHAWRVEGLGRSQALRRAQLAVLHGAVPGVSRGMILDDDREPAARLDAHPHHWAAFLLIGASD